MSAARWLAALIAAASFAPALALAEVDDAPAPPAAAADDGFVRIEARLCSQFEVCDPPCPMRDEQALAAPEAAAR